MKSIHRRHAGAVAAIAVAGVPARKLFQGDTASTTNSSSSSSDNNAAAVATSSSSSSDTATSSDMSGTDMSFSAMSGSDMSGSDMSSSDMSSSAHVRQRHVVHRHVQRHVLQHARLDRRRRRVHTGEVRATKFDLKGAIVGFSQSEPETAAFRVAETKSIRGRGGQDRGQEAAAHRRQLAAVQADLRHQGHAQSGRPVPHRRPTELRRSGAGLSAAKAKHVPVITIDRKVNATPCSDYVTFIGSNFVEQGKAGGRRAGQSGRQQGQHRHPAGFLGQQRDHRPAPAAS